MVLLYHSMYNTYKIDIKYSMVSKNYLKILKYQCIIIVTQTRQSITIFYGIRGMYVLYGNIFFKIFKTSLVYLFICFYCFVNQSTQSVECSIFVLEWWVFTKDLWKDSMCCCFAFNRNYLNIISILYAVWVVVCL